jgi:segregation and condensation protein A
MTDVAGNPAFDQGDTDQLPIGPAEDMLVVDLDGYEGPLDVLLALAKAQKVDLRRISILGLVEQYLAFIAATRRLRLELAADYLVMAAWLAYLKSRLLLPDPPADAAPSAEEMADRLALQLRRLEAMREAGSRLMGLNRLGRDVFGRGAPEGIRIKRKSQWMLGYNELLKAYGDIQSARTHQPLTIRKLPLYSMDEALNRLKAILGRSVDWMPLLDFLPPGFEGGLMFRSAVAGTFSASLEMVKEGAAELRQLELFGPIFVKRRAMGAASSDGMV